MPGRESLLQGNPVLRAAMDVVQFYLYGMIFEIFGRGLFPWGKIQSVCTDTVKSPLCNVLSPESGPDAIQSFFVTFGVSFAFARLFPNNSDRKIATAGAIATFGLAVLAEAAQEWVTHSGNGYDVITEGAGIIPAYIILRLLTERNWE